MPAYAAFILTSMLSTQILDFAQPPTGSLEQKDGNEQQRAPEGGTSPIATRCDGGADGGERRISAAQVSQQASLYSSEWVNVVQIYLESFGRTYYFR